MLLCVIFFSCQTSRKSMSKLIFKEQVKVGGVFANSTNWTRNSLSTDYRSLFAQNDTLFIIERVGEVDKKVWGTIWDSNRAKVLEYSNESGMLLDSTYNYSNLKDYLVYHVEKFDTASLDKHQILGGYRTFITQVINRKKVNTFFFSDAKSSFIHSKLSKQE